MPPRSTSMPHPCPAVSPDQAKRISRWPFNGAVISSVAVTDNITLAVILTAGPNGSWGAGVSVNYGDTLPVIGEVSEIDMYDPINNTGQLTFWADTGKGESIVRGNIEKIEIDLVATEVKWNPLERDGRRVSFRPGSLFAGQEREIWVTLRVPSERPGSRPSPCPERPGSCPEARRSDRAGPSEARDVFGA